MGTTLSDPLVGQTLDGRYQVIRRLARGGMATVYEALDTRLERTVALKVMHPGLAEDKAFVERFIREARSAARLSHPGVVGVFDQSADSGHVFLAMEYVAGRNLRDWLREKGRLTPREAFAVLEPVLAALGAAHDAGIIHRDIKPENVLIADDGRVKVADFGLARAATTTSSTGTALIGTVAYLSPEQVERGVADPRSDVYAAGILLYEVLTGAQPFGGETPIQVAYQHVNYDVPPPSERRESLPPQLDDLVQRATRRSPDARPANATAFLAEVVAVRRSLTQAQLDDAGPPLPADPAAQTLVVSRADAPPPRPAPAPYVPPHHMAPQHMAPQHTAPLPGTGGRGGPGDPYALPQRFARRRRRGVLALVLVLAAAVVMGVGAWRIAAGGSVTTPSLVGMTRAEAKAAAEKAGLDLVFAKEERFHERVPAGQVIETDPDPGRRIGKHGTVTAYLSKGPERYEVPDVAGMSLSAAESAIEERNLTFGNPREEFSDSVEAGSVIRTEPAKGTELAKNAAVTPVVSKGGRPVRLPDVIGRSLADARSILEQLGFEVGPTTEENDDRFAPGTVIGQDPAPARRMERGTEVALVVSKGPKLVTVPDVIGMSSEEAEEVLGELGLEVEVHEPFFGGFGESVVTRQDPPAGTQVTKGTRVDIYTD